MSDSADPSGRGSKDGENSSSHSSDGGDPSDQDDPRHESLLGRDSATEKPMEGVEASGSTSPGPKTGKASSPQGGLPAPGREASSPQGGLPTSGNAASSPQGGLPAVGLEVEVFLYYCFG